MMNGKDCDAPKDDSILVSKSEKKYSSAFPFSEKDIALTKDRDAKKIAKLINKGWSEESAIKAVANNSVVAIRVSEENFKNLEKIEKTKSYFVPVEEPTKTPLTAEMVAQDFVYCSASGIKELLNRIEAEYTNPDNENASCLLLNGNRITEQSASYCGGVFKITKTEFLYKGQVNVMYSPEELPKPLTIEDFQTSNSKYLGIYSDKTALDIINQRINAALKEEKNKTLEPKDELDLLRNIRKKVIELGGIAKCPSAVSYNVFKPAGSYAEMVTAKQPEVKSVGF